MDVAGLTAAEEGVARLAAEYDEELVDSAVRLLRRLQSRSGRTCDRCRKRKALADFGRESRDPTGLSRICRPCKKEVNATYQASLKT